MIAFQNFRTLEFVTPDLDTVVGRFGEIFEGEDGELDLPGSWLLSTLCSFLLLARVRTTMINTQTHLTLVSTRLSLSLARSLPPPLHTHT